MKISTLSPRLVPAALAAACSLALVAPVFAQKTLDHYIQPSLKDLSASVDVVSKNDRELAKIGKGYVDAYKLSKQEVWAKEPGRVRFQGKQGVFTIRYVTNGNRKLTEVPTLRIKDVDDISQEPSKGDSIVDLGVISTTWANRVVSRWLRTEQRAGKTVQIFQTWYKEDPRRKYTFVLDPATKTVVERIEHHRNKKKEGYRKRLVYSEVKQVDGVSVPTRVELYNGEGKLAGVMKYDAIKINSGLPDTMFTF
ncbi:MAG: hypothetical protein ACK47B_00740 [Armatimonadota bacterium]